MNAYPHNKTEVTIDDKENHSLAIFHPEPVGALIGLREVGTQVCQRIRWVVGIIAINRIAPTFTANRVFGSNGLSGTDWLEKFQIL